MNGLLSMIGMQTELDYLIGDFPACFGDTPLAIPKGSIPSDKQKCQLKEQHEFTIKGIKIMADSKKDAIKERLVNHPIKDINISNMIKKYRKKPVIIEAIQWNGENLSEIDEFTRGKVKNHESVLIIPTLEGDMYASLNDYIIKGVNGEFYPCKPNIFAKTYEEVTE